MKSTQIFVIIIAILFFASCTMKQTDLEFEKAVAYEIFPDLLDSLFCDSRLLPPPPPPDFYGQDTTDWEKSKEMVDFLKRKSALEKDTTKFVVAISDSTYKIDENAKNRLIEFYKKNDLKLYDVSNNQRYKIDISKLKHKNKIRLIYTSDLPQGTKFWKGNYNFHLSGVTGFSRIQFDKTKQFGVLNSVYDIGRLSGVSVIVFIRKVDNKWRIEKIDVTGVS